MPEALFTVRKDGKTVVVELSEPPGALMHPCHGIFVRRPGTSKESAWWVREEDLVLLQSGSTTIQESAEEVETDVESEEEGGEPPRATPSTPKSVRQSQKKRTPRPKSDAFLRARNAHQLGDRFRGPRTPRWR